MAILFALGNWGDRPHWHHMYHLSSSSSPSIRTWDLLNGETLAAKKVHCKVKRINRVGSFWIDIYAHWWNNFGCIEEIRESRNDNSKFAKEIHIRQLDLIYIYTIDRHNDPNCQQRTSSLLNVTKTPGIATWCYHLFRRMFYRTLTQT